MPTPIGDAPVAVIEWRCSCVTCAVAGMRALPVTGFATPMWRVIGMPAMRRSPGAGHDLPPERRMTFHRDVGRRQADVLGKPRVQSLALPQHAPCGAVLPPTRQHGAPTGSGGLVAAAHRWARRMHANTV